MKADYFLAHVNYKITGGSRFYWDCYGPNAWSLEIGNNSAVIDCVTQMVYEIAVHDNNDLCYKWVDPDFVEKYVAASESKGFDPWIAYDDVRYNLELDESAILLLIK